MKRIFSNGPDKDFVLNPLNRLIAKSARVYLAAPFFTEPEPIRDAVKSGKAVQLLVGLNASTSPEALGQLQGIPSLALRYLTHRFHAKIFIFDDAVMIGSSNLTDGGLRSNREAVVCLDQPEDLEMIEEARGLFLELWDSAQVLTVEKLAAFREAYRLIKNSKAPIPMPLLGRRLAARNQSTSTLIAGQGLGSVFSFRISGGRFTSNIARPSPR